MRAEGAYQDKAEPTASPRCMCTMHSLCIAHAGVHQNTVPRKGRDNGGMHVMNPIRMTRDYGVDEAIASLRAFALPSDIPYSSLFPGTCKICARKWQSTQQPNHRVWILPKQRGRSASMRSGQAGSGRSSWKISRSELPVQSATALDGCREKPLNPSSLAKPRVAAQASTLCGRSGTRTGV